MFKKYFSAGLLLWCPLVITLWVLETIIRWSDSVVQLLPPNLRPEVLIGYEIPGIGLVIAAAVIFVTGILVANFIGQWIVSRWERFLEKIPLVRPIYSGVKQILETVLSDRTQSFHDVVLVEFPRKDCWTYGFVVATPGAGTQKEMGGEDMITVFVPTAPNPTSGYVVMVERAAVRKTSTSVEDAFKFHVSLGVMTPAAQNAEKSPEAAPENASGTATQA
ncbi:DUF502 domain-containing protein [Sutterella sp.]|uniref:DUF502 domain-containing protein n=1 Tax=Sutterella sp. TaxID=1981025 RepID=UPI0026DEDDD4|nr:DUF502 domain-containing protein [Sutterella sp.]MDO5530688.1 DUF502 domain-containing protein [Sutterella sp.]